MRYVVDTNVPIVANFGASRAHEADTTLACVEAAVIFLMEVIEKHQIFLDQAGEIQAEYRSYLKPKGQPGVGDRFYQLVLNSHPEKITRLPLEKDGAGNFLDLPNALASSNFDLSDRKFAALAKKAKAKVANCVDSDWLEHIAVLKKTGIRVRFVCGKAAATRD